MSRTVSRKLENSVRKVFGVADVLPDDGGRYMVIRRTASVSDLMVVSRTSKEE